jgi:hypothetical protein
MSKKKRRMREQIATLDERAGVLLELFFDLDSKQAGSPAARNIAVQLARQLVARRDLARSLAASRSLPTIKSAMLN